MYRPPSSAQASGPSSTLGSQGDRAAAAPGVRIHAERQASVDFAGPEGANPGVRNAASSPHYAALDGLRGVAILGVLLHNADISLLTGALVDRVFSVLMHAGWAGVDLFFVLSGFLITDQLLRYARATNYYAAFYVRRTLRIVPLYYAVLAFFFVVLPALGLQPEKLAETASNQVWLWTFLFNWANPLGYTVFGFGHFWSLAVEEQFYLVWPAIVRRCRPRTLLIVAIGLAVAAFGIRLLLVEHGADPLMAYQFTVTRMDALAAGAAVAVGVREPPFEDWVRRRARWIVLAAIGSLICVSIPTRWLTWDHAGTATYGQSVLAIGFAALTAVAVIAPTTFRADRLLESAALRKVGRYSYAMYVLHLPIHVFWLGPIFSAALPQRDAVGSAALYVAAVSLASFAAAALTYRLIERPFLRLKGRLARFDVREA